MTTLKIWGLVKDRQCHVACHRFAVTKRRNKFRVSKIGQRSISKPEKRRIFGNDVQLLQIAVDIDFYLELDISIHLNPRCLRWWIMESRKL